MNSNTGKIVYFMNLSMDENFILLYYQDIDKSMMRGKSVNVS